MVNFKDWIINKFWYNTKVTHDDISPEVALAVSSPRLLARVFNKLKVFKMLMVRSTNVNDIPCWSQKAPLAGLYVVHGTVLYKKLEAGFKRASELRQFAPDGMAALQLPRVEARSEAKSKDDEWKGGN